jgi:hypothetical protein
MKKNELGRECCTYGGQEMVLEVKLEERKPLGITRCRRENNIKTNPRGVG